MRMALGKYIDYIYIPPSLLCLYSTKGSNALPQDLLKIWSREIRV